MPAFMSTPHRAHVAARVVSIGITPTTRMRQQHSGNPEGLRWFSRSSSEQFASQTRTSDAPGWIQPQHGNCRRSIDISVHRYFAHQRRERIWQIYNTLFVIALVSELVFLRPRSPVWREGIDAAHRLTELPP